MPLWADETTQLVNDAMKRAKKTKVEIPETKNREGYKAAEEADAYLKTEKFMKRLDEEKNKIRKTIGVSDSPMQSKVGRQTILSGKDRIYIFISSTIPRNTLMSYVRDLDHLKEPNIILCLRGFIGGMKKVQPTLDFINDLVKKDPSCNTDKCEYYRANIDIDPLAFRYFDINKVPAVAYIENVNMENTEQSIGTPGNIKSKGVSNVFYGDMPLSYSLDKLSKKHTKLKNLTRKLERRGFYHGE